jgi:hypothetical protein
VTYHIESRSDIGRTAWYTNGNHFGEKVSGCYVEDARLKRLAEVALNFICFPVQESEKLASLSSRHGSRFVVTCDSNNASDRNFLAAEIDLWEIPGGVTDSRIFKRPEPT